MSAMDTNLSPTSPVAPRIKPGQHPVETGIYTLLTPAIEAAYSAIQLWVRRRIPGGTMVGPPRYGKTRAIRYMTKMLEEDFPGMPLVSLRCISSKAPNEDRFYGWILDAIGHSFRSGKPAAKLFRVVEFMRERVAESGQRRVVWFLDDSQSLHVEQFAWLMNVYNELDAAEIKMTLILVGQPELLHQRTAFLAARQQQVVGRFMVQDVRFSGVKSEGDLAEIMAGYDEQSEYPPSSGWTFTRFFFPVAFSMGWRLADLAPDLWESFKNHTGSSGRPEVPMQYCTAVCEHVLTEFADALTAAPMIGKRELDAAVKLSGFVEREVVLGASVRAG